MSLFKLESDRVEVTKSLSLLKPFRDINEREDSDLLFSYIYYMHDWESPYSIYEEDERYEKLKDELFDGEDPPEIVEPAVELYNELTNTHSLKLLNSARQAVRELQKYFEEVKIMGSKNEGREAKDLMANLKSVGEIIKSLKKWEETIKQEKDEVRIRQDVEIDKFNE